MRARVPLVISIRHDSQRMPVEHDKWLSDALGRPVFTVSMPLRPGELSHHMHSEAPATYQARLSADARDDLRSLSQTGLSVVTATLVLDRAPGSGSVDSAASVRDARADDEDAVARLAERGFRATRFHLDPQVPADAADRVSAAWARSAVRGDRGDEVLLAEVGGSLAGFLTVNPVDGGRVRDIDLIAVEPALRGRGVGAALVAEFARRAENRCDRIRVGTQAGNVAAIRFYERMGFLTREAYFDLHAHAGPWGAG